MPANKLKFAPNVPVKLALTDPQGEYDDSLRQGNFVTTTGLQFSLPRPAVELLYGLDPRPGEEVQICKHWKGGPHDPFEWAVCLTPASEQYRAAEEIAASEAQDAPESPIPDQRPVTRPQAQKAAVAPPTPIRKPARRQPAEPQPRLFDRGTGTDGPAPQPRPGAIPLPAVARKTPYGQMLRHIVRTVKAVLTEENLQLGDGPTQDLISTVYIDAAKRTGIVYDFGDAEGRPQ